MPQKEGFGGVVLSGDSVGEGWEQQNEGFDGWNGGEWWMGGIVGDKRQIREMGNRFALKERERERERED